MPSANELYETIANDLPIGIWRADEQGKLIFINKKIKDYFSDCKLGCHFSDLITDMMNKALVLNHWKDTEIINIEFPKIINNETKWYRFTANRIEDQYIGTIENITSEKITLPALMNLREELKVALF